MWWGDAPGNDIKSIEGKVIDSLAQFADELDDFSDILFHHVFINDDDFEGPCVVVTGGSKPDEILCTYHQKMEWDHEPLDEETAENLRKQGIPVGEDMKRATPRWMKQPKNRN